jgi:hypothetical protein
VTATYRVLSYDPVDDGCNVKGEFNWFVRFSGVRLWGLRQAIRGLRLQGYDDDVSILVELEDGNSGERREGE